MAKSTKDPKDNPVNPADANRAPKKSPEWLQNIKDFFRMIFVSPFALIARIAQRIALGKEGAQKADDMAEADFKSSQERKAAEKVAESMDKEINSLLKQRNQDPAYCAEPLNIKNCEIYIPDNGRDDLLYAINVTCQNDTCYNHARDFALYLDKDGQLICNSMVPNSVVAQVRELLDTIQLNVREPIAEEPQAPEASASPETSSDPVSQDEGTTPDESVPEWQPQKTEQTQPALFFSDTTMPEGCQFEGTYRGQKIIDVTVPNNPKTAITCNEQTFQTQATITYKGQNFECTYKDCAIQIEGPIAGLNSTDYALIAKAMHCAFWDLTRNASIVASGKTNSINGFACEAITKDVAQELASNDPKQMLYIIPDAITNQDIVVDVKPDKSKNAYVHFRVAQETTDGLTLTPANKDLEVKVHPKSPQGKVARQLVYAYMQTAGYDESAFLKGMNSIYKCCEDKNAKDQQAKQAVSFADKVSSGNDRVCIVAEWSSPIPEDVLGRVAKAWDLPDTLSEKLYKTTIEKVSGSIRKAGQGYYVLGVIGQAIVEYDKETSSVKAHLFGSAQEVSVDVKGNDVQSALTTVLNELGIQYSRKEPTVDNQLPDDSEGKNTGDAEKLAARDYWSEETTI